MIGRKKTEDKWTAGHTDSNLESFGCYLDKAVSSVEVDLILSNFTTIC